MRALSDMSIAERIYHNVIENGRYMLLVEGVQTTLIIVLLTCLLGGVMGLLVCAAKMNRNRVLSTLANVYIYFFRSIPVLLLLMLSFFVVFAGRGLSAVTISIIAFAFYHSAFAADIFRSGLLAIKKDQYEASTALGFTKMQAVFYIIIPQAVRIIFPIYKGEMIRQTSISSIVRIHWCKRFNKSHRPYKKPNFRCLYTITSSTCFILHNYRGVYIRINNY